VIKFVSDLWQVGGFLPVSAVSSTNATDRHEILLNVALNTIVWVPFLLIKVHQLMKNPGVYRGSKDIEIASI
jgi:hypothetical protein